MKILLFPHFSPDQNLCKFKALIEYFGVRHQKYQSGFL
jgi:hypothetical protein